MRPMNEEMYACVDKESNRYGGWKNEWKLFPTEVGANRFKTHHACKPLTVVKVKIVLAEECSDGT